MKTFKKLKNLKKREKTQLNGESLMRSVKSDAGKGVLYSVLCDGNGLLVLIHEAKERNSEETGDVNAQGDDSTEITSTAGDRHLQSRWESGSVRMIAILLWVIKSAKEGKAFKNTGFEMEKEETSKDSSIGLPRVNEDDAGDDDAEAAGSNNDETTERKDESQENKRKRTVLDLNELCEDDSDSEEQVEPLLPHSCALRKAFHGRDIPLEKGVLKATTDTVRAKRRKFCLSTGQWIDEDGTGDTGILGVTQSSGSLCSGSMES